jgi:glycosyltransferase involved in cell wall biosynthesis
LVRVLFDGRPVRDPVSGVARYCASLSNALAVRAKGFDIDVLVQGKGGPGRPLDSYSPAVKFTRFDAMTSNRKVQNAFLEFAPRLLVRSFVRKYQLLHETYFANVGSGAGVKTVATIHDVIPLDHPEYVNRRNRALSKQNFYRQAKESAHIICVSQYTKSRVIALSGVSSDKITVIGCGVDLPMAVEGSKHGAQIAGSIAAGDRYGLFIGNIEPRKNLEALIRIWPRIRRAHPEMKLVVAGKRNYIADPVLAFGAGTLGESFVYLGPVSEREKWRLMAGMEVLMFPSFSEGYGIPVIEAYQVGRPAVFSRCTALTELALDDRQLFDPYSDAEIEAAILRVLDHPNWLTDVQKKSSAWVETMSWEHVADRTLAVYEQVAGR